jgi:serine/threonine protein kinase
MVKQVSFGESMSNNFLPQNQLRTRAEHPCLVPFAGFVLPNQNSPGMIATEYMHNGSLKIVLQRERGARPPRFWTATVKAVTICGIASGLRFLRSQGIVHRRLDPSAILFDARGLSHLDEFASGLSEEESDLCQSESDDIWLFGAIVYEIVVEKPIFSDSLKPLQVMNQIVSHEQPEIPDEIGDEIALLIERCWSSDALQRPSFDAILDDLQVAEFWGAIPVDIAVVKKYLEEVHQWEESRCPD